MKQTALSITAIAVSLIAIAVSLTNKPEAGVTPEQFADFKTTTEKSLQIEIDGHRSQNAAIMKLMADVDSVKSGQSQFTEVADLLRKKMESDSELDQVQTTAITKFAEDIRKIKKELNIE